MSWQEGAAYIGGMVLFSIGFGITNGIESGFMALGLFLMLLSIVGEWE